MSDSVSSHVAKDSWLRRIFGRGTHRRPSQQIMTGEHPATSALAAPGGEASLKMGELDWSVFAKARRLEVAREALGEPPVEERAIVRRPAAELDWSVFARPAMTTTSGLDPRALHGSAPTEPAPGPEPRA